MFRCPITAPLRKKGSILPIGVTLFSEAVPDDQGSHQPSERQSPSPVFIRVPCVFLPFSSPRIPMLDPCLLLRPYPPSKKCVIPTAFRKHCLHLPSEMFWRYPQPPLPGDVIVSAAPSWSISRVHCIPHVQTKLEMDCSARFSRDEGVRHCDVAERYGVPVSRP